MKKFLTLLLAISCLVGPVYSAHANPIESAIGFINDPLKLDSSSRRVTESINRSITALYDLQNRTDIQITGHIENLRSIVEDFHDSLQSNIQSAIDDLYNRALIIEKEIHKDVVNLIWRAECAAYNVTEVFNRTLLELINTLSNANPRLSIAKLLNVLRAEIDPVTVVSPDEKFYRIEKASMQRLEDIEESDDAYLIFSTYINLARLAKETQCYYLDSVGQTRFATEHYEYENLASPWARVVNVVR